MYTYICFHAYELSYFDEYNLIICIAIYAHILIYLYVYTMFIGKLVELLGILCADTLQSYKKFAATNPSIFSHVCSLLYIKIVVTVIISIMIINTMSSTIVHLYVLILFPCILHTYYSLT